MALADVLAKLGETEEDQEQKITEILQNADTLAAKVSTLSGSVAALEAKRDELLGEKKKLNAAKKILVENGIDPDDENASEKLKAKLSAEGKTSSQSDLEVIELRSALNRLNTQVEELKTESETLKQEKAEMSAKERKNEIEKGVLKHLESTGAGVCLAASKLFALNKNSFELAEDGKTVLWKDGDDLKTLEDFAMASASNPEDSIFWAGKGSSGVGQIPGSSGNAQTRRATSTNNPMEVGGNLTEATRIIKRDPKNAERLIAEARSKGKLMPAIANMMKHRKA